MPTASTLQLSLIVHMHVVAMTMAALTSKPHIITILQDDMGYHDSGIRNEDAVPYTPNITALARNGIILSHHCACLRACVLECAHVLAHACCFSTAF